jgi:hypothetical protein
LCESEKTSLEDDEEDDERLLLETGSFKPDLSRESGSLILYPPFDS